MKLKYFLVAFLISLPFWWGVNLLQENLEDYLLAQIAKPFQEIQLIEIPKKPSKPLLEIEAKSAISVKINSTGQEKILFEKDSEKPLPIASVTKLMTALVVLENENYNLENLITISPIAASQENGFHPGNLRAGERVTLRKLLELILIYSSNDAAWALAEVIGTENFVQDFVQEMNQKAKVLGLENTHFANPTGLDPSGPISIEGGLIFFNHSTAKDLFRLTNYILKNQPLILEISRREPSSPSEIGILNLFLTQRVIGGKTGYTDTAGGCIVFVFSDDGTPEIFFINVILGAESPAARIEEMQKLVDWLNL